VVFRADGHVLRTASQVGPGDALQVRLAPSGARTLEECEQVDAVVTAGKGK